MIEKKKAKITNLQVGQKISKEQQSTKSNALIFSGVLIAMSSILLLIFVLSEKVFHLG